jgi:DNA polymerase-3 subunit delta
MLYVIYGKDALGRKEALDKIRAELDKDGSLATNTIAFDARSTSPQEAIAACDTLPFLGDTRLVVLEGALATADRARRASRSRGASPSNDGNGAAISVWTPLAEYVPRMPPSTTLVLLDADATKASPLVKAVAPHATFIECVPPDDRKLAAWVTARAKKIGLKIDAPAASLLGELIGPDSWLLASELDKLHAYAGDDVVREKDVHELVSRAKEHKSWDLTDAILDGQSAKAARVLSEMLEDGQPPQLLIGAIAGRLRRAAIVRDMLDRGESGSAIADAIGAKKAYGLDRAIQQAQRHSLADIRAAYARLIEADLDVKRGLMDDERLALELAVQELASRPAVTARR